MPSPTPDEPDLLTLYELAVQHPLAEVSFIERAWAHYFADASDPLLLREDFAGTCAVAAAWVASDPDRQAMAVELDETTASWAADRHDDPDLHIVVADVMLVDEPRVDVTLSLNFSTLIYHDDDSLLAYLKHTRQGLREDGLLILDLFGGKSVNKPTLQRREIQPDDLGVAPFTYTWQQDARSATTGRIRCKIHFELSGAKVIPDAFVYDWRLWSLAELADAAKRAGFSCCEPWWSPPTSSRPFEPIAQAPSADEWVCYVVCKR